MDTEPTQIEPAPASALDKFIDATLSFVDSEFCPSAWSLKNDCGWLMDQDEFFEHTDIYREAFQFEADRRFDEVLDGMIDDSSRFCLKVPKPERSEIRDKVEGAFIDYRVAHEILPVTVGLALGLRSAGMAPSHARVIMAAFFRNYRKEEL